MKNSQEITLDLNDFTTEEIKLLKKYNMKLPLLSCNVNSDYLLFTNEDKKINDLVLKIMRKGYLDGLLLNQKEREQFFDRLDGKENGIK